MSKQFASISLPITEEEYRNDGNLHYSTLATYERGGFNAIATLNERKESPSLLFGSLVDLMITGTRDEFEKQYVIADFPELQPAFLKYAKALYDKFHIQYSSLTKVPDADILEVANEIEFYKTWRPENRIKAAKEQCEEYYRLLIVAEGKTVIDQQTYDEAAAAARALRTNQATAWYFAKDNPFDGIERVYQPKFKADFDGITYSAMMDLVITDHNAKKIYPCDLKTSSHMEYEFYKSFLDWSYSIQAAQYAAILKANIEKDDYFKDFEIMPYRFIVVNRKSLNPLVWEWPYTFTDTTVELSTSKGYPIRLRNFREIGRELHHYLETQQNTPDGIVVDRTNKIDDWIKRM